MIFSEENYKIFVIIGDFIYFLGIRRYGNIGGGLYFVLAMISQIIYYYNYKNDIKPTFLKVFEMMSGLVSPKSIGLTNKEQIYNLVKQTKTLFIFCEYNLDLIIPIFIFFISFVPLIKHCTLIKFLFIIFLTVYFMQWLVIIYLI